MNARLIGGPTHNYQIHSRHHPNSHGAARWADMVPLVKSRNRCNVLVFVLVVTPQWPSAPGNLATPLMHNPASTETETEVWNLKQLSVEERGQGLCRQLPCSIAEGEKQAGKACGAFWALHSEDWEP